MDSLPEGFVDLTTAQNAPDQTNVNVIGMVVDILLPTKTAKGTWMLTLRVLDLALHQDIYQREGRYVQANGLTVRYFRDIPEDLPKVRAIGDIVLIRNISRKIFKVPMLLAHNGTGTVVFPSAGIPARNFEISFRGTHRLECFGAPVHKEAVSIQDQRYIIALKDEMKSIVDDIGKVVVDAHGLPNNDQLRRSGHDGSRALETTGAKRHGESLPPSAPKRMRPNTMGSKFRLIEELRHYEFADLCVQVVKIFHHNYGCDLYVTDYTENPDMFHYTPPDAEGGDAARDGDSFGYAGPQKRAWPGPYGKLVLKLNLKDPHASYVRREVNENDFIQCRNVKMKKMPGGATLEGDMWEDSWHSDKINVSRVYAHGRADVDAIVRRREKYWEDFEQSREPVQKLTKTEKKKRKRQRKAEMTAREQGSHAMPAKDGEDDQDDAPRTATISSEVQGSRKTATNPHIRCSYEEVHISSVREINDPDDSYHTVTAPNGNAWKLPFVNVKQRARVRCIDFSPQSLADFAVPMNRNNDNTSDGFSDSYGTSSSQKYEWNFSLLLEDAPKSTRNAAASPDDRIWVELGHAEAQHLLGNAMPDPCDLTRNRSVLAQLRERMYILWGNLAERKSTEGKEGVSEAPLSNRPFECCIAEYGIPVEDNDSLDEETSKVAVREDRWGWRRCHRMFGVTIL